MSLRDMAYTVKALTELRSVRSELECCARHETQSEFADTRELAVKRVIEKLDLHDDDYTRDLVRLMLVA